MEKLDPTDVAETKRKLAELASRVIALESDLATGLEEWTRKMTAGAMGERAKAIVEGFDRRLRSLQADVMGSLRNRDDDVEKHAERLDALEEKLGEAETLPNANALQGVFERLTQLETKGASYRRQLADGKQRVDELSRNLYQHISGHLPKLDEGAKARIERAAQLEIERDEKIAENAMSAERMAFEENARLRSQLFQAQRDCSALLGRIGSITNALEGAGRPKKRVKLALKIIRGAG